MAVKFANRMNLLKGSEIRALLALLPAPAKLIAAAIGAAAAVGLFLYYMVSRRRAAAAAQTVQTRKTALQRQTEEYLRLREDARQAEDAARTAAASAEGLTQQLQGQLVTLLAQVHFPYLLHGLSGL